MDTNERCGIIGGAYSFDDYLDSSAVIAMLLGIRYIQSRNSCTGTAIGRLHMLTGNASHYPVVLTGTRIQTSINWLLFMFCDHH